MERTAGFQEEWSRQRTICKGVEIGVGFGGIESERLRAGTNRKEDDFKNFIPLPRTPVRAFSSYHPETKVS